LSSCICYVGIAIRYVKYTIADLLYIIYLIRISGGRYWSHVARYRSDSSGRRILLCTGFVPCFGVMPLSLSLRATTCLHASRSRWPGVGGWMLLLYQWSKIESVTTNIARATTFAAVLSFSLVLGRMACSWASWLAPRPAQYGFSPIRLPAGL